MSLFLKLSPFILILAISCASRESGWEKKTESVQMNSAEMATTKKDAIAAWNGRVVKEKLQTALNHFEKLHAADSGNLETLIFLTRGYYLLADSHTDNVDEKKKTYEKAASFGEKAMATNSAFRESIKSGKNVEESINQLTSSEVPAIYWTAASLGKWAKASGIAAALKYKTRIKAMIERVEKLQPDFFFAAPSRYWGGFYAVAPSFAGGDMNKSRIQFEKSLKMAPEYQGTKVLMAEVYFTKEGKKEEFKKVLNEVLSSRFDNHPEIGPENALEKKKAEKLLKNIDELF
jgi:hypothetical protein